MDGHISRPPFDENGYAAYEGKVKKKKSTPLRWIIPAGLLLIVAAIVLIIRFRPKEPGAFCRAAIKDAVTDSFGGGDPLMKALGLDSVRKRLESRDFLLDTVLAVESVTAAEGTDLYNLIGLLGMEPEDIPSGIGVGVTVESRKDQGFHAKLAAALSSIRIVLFRFWGDTETLTVSSPRLAEEGLTFAYTELFGNWYQNEGWNLLPEESRQQTKDKVRTVLERYKIIAILRQLISSDSPIQYLGKGYDKAMDELLAKIRFSEAKNASGRRVQKKFHIGGEHVLCYGYHAEIDTEEICKRVRAVTGLSKGDFKPAAGMETVEAMLYITRRGELISLSFSTELDFRGTVVPIEFSYDASGDADPQDHFTARVRIGIGNTPVTLMISKNTVKNAYGIRSRWDGSLTISEEEYAILIQSNYDTKAKRIEVTAKTFWDGVSVGGMEAEGTVSPKDEYEMNFRKMKFWDTFSGATLNLTWKFTVSEKKDSFSIKPPATLLDVNLMSGEQWKDFRDEVKENLETYLKYLNDLF
ncbi:MAG: hypothetical protein J5872_03040 [Lachnospiraceae bacterium]|nr:hypothetical protein [Lachnospiraceae bacterium]